MNCRLFGSNAGWLVGAPQIWRSKPGSSAGSAFGASWAVTVLKKVWSKLTGWPAKVSGALFWMNVWMLVL
jgi:hypothetical protein